MIKLMKKAAPISDFRFEEGAGICEEELIELESKKCFEFFWNEANTKEASKGFGLIRDRYPALPDISSIASVGYGFGAIIIGVERGWIKRELGIERILGTLNTLLINAQHFNGFFYHFLDMTSAKRKNNCEVSIIDTAICLCGAIAAGEYFGGEIKKKVTELYKRVNWKWYFDLGVKQFYMGYTQEGGFCGHWDFSGEQLMLYPLAAASPTYPVNGAAMYSFKRHLGIFEGKEFIHSWFGSLFTHQFSHCWIDYRNKVDNYGVNWWQNSVIATKNDISFCNMNSEKFKTFKEGFGITACDGPLGYNGRYGVIPNSLDNSENFIDGTVPPAGAAGSIVFEPKEAKGALMKYYIKYPLIWGKYGFKDAFNLDMNWFAEDVIGIDKGVTLIMLENYRTGLIWNYCMKNKYIKEGLIKTGFAPC